MAGAWENVKWAERLRSNRFMLSSLRRVLFVRGRGGHHILVVFVSADALGCWTAVDPTHLVLRQEHMGRVYSR